MIEDASFVIDLLHDDPDAVQYLDTIERGTRPEKVAAITVLERYEAVPQLDVPGEHKREILDVLDTRHVVDADATAMREAKISGALVSRGEGIDREVCIIGATALLTDEPVVTRNRDRFDRIDGLDVETY